MCLKSVAFAVLFVLFISVFCFAEEMQYSSPACSALYLFTPFTPVSTEVNTSFGDATYCTVNGLLGGTIDVHHCLCEYEGQGKWRCRASVSFEVDEGQDQWPDDPNSNCRWDHSGMEPACLHVWCELIP